MTTIRMASTFASTGRSMKNFEIMAGPSARGALCLRIGGGLNLRIDLLARDCAQETNHDHSIVGRETALNDAHRIDERADFDLALLDHVILVGDQNVAAALVAAERDVR